MAAFLEGGGQMSALIAAHDWSATLPPVERWPQSLKTAVGLLIHSPVPMVLLWGADGIMVYNDAYAGFAGTRHPGLLGARVLEGWPEAAELNAHVMATCMAGGTLQYKDRELVLNRHGRPETTWLDLFYSPVTDESGRPGGVIAVVVETTERVMAERRIVAQRDRLGQMFEQAPSFMAMLSGPDHRFEFVNPAYQQLIGHRAITGKTVVEALPEVVDQGYLALLDEVYASGKAFRAKGAKFAMRAVPGAASIERYVDFVFQPVTDRSGKVTGIFTEGYDVSDHVAATEAILAGELALRGRSEQLAMATEAAQIGTWDFNPVTGTLNWDVRCKALFGLPPDAAITYDTFREGIHPEDRERVDRAVQLSLDPDGSGAYEAEFRSIGFQDGRERWLAAAGRTWFEDRKPTRFIGTVMDVSPQKKVERLLRESEARFQSFAQAMMNHVWSATPDGQLDWFNEQVFRYTGLEFPALEGERWASIVHPDDLLATAMRWSDALKSGETYESEFRLRRADGAFRWHIARAVPIRDDAGAVTRWIGTNTDIHDQKAVSAALEDINATLEQRVQERTSQLQQTEEALRQAQKMEAVGQLTGGIAHDFNNLLQGITGALDRVQNRIAQGRHNDVDRFLKAAVDSANRAAALTHRLLAFSRRQTLDPRPVDANRLIGGMEDLVRRTMGPNVRIEVVGAGGLWPVRVDPSQLENSLLNLCINARDAMPDGGILTIETANKWLDERAARERELPPGQYVSLCVTDTGTGMPPDVIARAFDPFFTTKPLGQGTGLGLSMIYGFVRQSGGQVRIYSEENSGTTMCLYFPRYLGEVEEAEPQGAEIMERGFGETVLVVDDEATVRMLIAEVLSENYYNILEAGDGPSALKILEGSRRIDLMITDVGLPGGMNGRQVADAARVLRKNLKVLFITGYAENAAVGNGHLDSGMEILAKPFAMSTLASKVRAMIES